MTQSSSTHECPAPGCAARVSNEMFACRRDWYRLPRSLRDAIWRTYNAGGGAPHEAAMVDAIDWYRANARPVPAPAKPVDPQLF